MDPRPILEPSTAIETLAVHAGESPGDHLGALTTPVYRAAVFAFPNAKEGAAIHEGREHGYFYGRIGNPTQGAVETAVAALEGGSSALVTASGMAAISATMFTLVGCGDHVLATSSIYATTGILLEHVLGRLGVSCTFFDPEQPASLGAALRDETRVVLLESPTNPTLRIADLAALLSLARAAGVTSVVDNTFATSFNQRPLELGADIVVHSATKYLGGHGDLLAGVVVGAPEFVDRLRWHTQKVLGGVVAPDTAWLLHRGIKTFALRMARHNENALAVARFLSGHSRVKRVHYPGLPSHPQHEVARRQMRGFGGVVAFEVESVEAARKLVDALRLCSLAVSLGDVATLIQHSASMTHASVAPERRAASGISDGLLRLSVGIEAIDDLVADLDQALNHL